MSQSSFNCFLIAAITADGFIGRGDADLSTRWTSKEDAAFYRQKSTEAEAVIMGSKTFATLGNKPLPNRVNIIYSRSEIPRTIDLKSVSSLELGRAYRTSLTPPKLIDRLSELGLNALAVSGGASVYRQFLESRAINQIFLTVEPLFFGDGVKLIDRKIDTLNLKLLEIKKLSAQTIVLHYQVNYD